MTAAPAAQPRRFLFIDGLRGIAALSVIVPHAIGLLVHPDGGAAAPIILKLSPYFAQGVQVFFVISGFAIAYSMKDAVSNVDFSVGRFILRRSVRLDPPYWAALILYGLVEAARALAAHKAIVLPDLHKTLAHLFYLQGLLRYEQFNVVFWTLCLEIQFYVVFAIMVRFTSLLTRGSTLASHRHEIVSTISLCAFVIFFAISHLLWAPLDSKGWFVPYFYVFLAGVLTCWRAIDRISDAAFLPCIALLCIGCGILRTPDRQFAALTVIVIYAAIRAGALNHWLRRSAFQGLGRISYSIYLLHVPVALVIGGLRVRLGGGSTAASFLAFATVYILTIVSSVVFYRLVEAPCLRASEHLKRLFLSKTTISQPR